MMRNFARIENISGAARRNFSLIAGILALAFSAASLPAAHACDCEKNHDCKDKKNCEHKSKKKGKKQAEGSAEAPKSE
jgi:hypothetical protein